MYILRSTAVEFTQGQKINYKFGQALFKLGEINEDEDSAAAHNSFRARNRSESPANSIGRKYYGSFIGSFSLTRTLPPCENIETIRYAVRYL